MCIIKSLELLRRQQPSIMQQFGASAFYTVVRWHKLGKMDNKCILHISIFLAICVPKIIKFCGYLTKFWQKQFGSFFGTPCMYSLFWHMQNIQWNQTRSSLTKNSANCKICKIKHEVTANAKSNHRPHSIMSQTVKSLKSNMKISYHIGLIQNTASCKVSKNKHKVTANAYKKISHQPRSLQ